MIIDVQVIDHSEQRYETTGDYWWRKLFNSREDVLDVRVSKLGDWRYEMLVAHHEITEALLCRQHGIEEPDIKAFDEEFEAARAAAIARDPNALHFIFRNEFVASTDFEPGDCPLAPYYKEHQIATGFERIMAQQLGVLWSSYERACDEVHPGG